MCGGTCSRIEMDKQSLSCGEMDHEAMLRGHLERLIWDVEEYDGQARPFLTDRQNEIEKFDNEWEAKRDETRDGNNAPLLSRWKWVHLANRNIRALRSWND